MLKVDDLTLHYSASQILWGVSLEARLGAVTAVMGTNGVGKTSLLRAIAGRHPYSGGTITLDGQALDHPTAAQAAKAGIAYVPQGREVFPLLTVTENLQTGFACLPRSEHKIPPRIYELFPVLEQMKNRRGGDLSGGQQQQLAIARALIAQPKVLLLDEPTEGIQPNIIKQIGKVIELLREEGKIAIVLVEQYFDFAYGLADEFCVLNRGEVVLSKPSNAVTKQEILERVSI
ncbi:urea ABC transporter ATP-binding subunit UrtE [Roseinatronobacter bogoriensis]|uniref:Urea ABC transporter ATP-binding subunit UrtE n=1 Tax=Roseinatronobacter bogoriensis subsp. barguzinensis TaxID=441209 RepID=A0A2K8KFQ3_9RHOB|nr:MULTISPECIES: urea ABC transporter ATP-binding subunit UrtE [Rhodobaca]ATX64990.1 urea ABC transporter ATP-binding subunit UrtE [Rhodobaca barguzinensis]MBB4208812.1 urea transport system ATP-binding protein [Rhodobaca bogoriensis DSM 18756]TDW37920.1 amino acid/amide ABC transporter ATP-binding protein 2 (HAAT family) [Rhodobaca barguzinensis]TDY69910.1 amino acid/amide ABC transporter ATP-binding protein 2 (HAAT family) [Rhodobaca bogoriensis DSM 18756]